VAKKETWGGRSRTGRVAGDWGHLQISEILSKKDSFRLTGPFVSAEDGPSLLLCPKKHKRKNKGGSGRVGRRQTDLREKQTSEKGVKVRFGRACVISPPSMGI